MNWRGGPFAKVSSQIAFELKVNERRIAQQFIQVWNRDFNNRRALLFHFVDSRSDDPSYLLVFERIAKQGSQSSEARATQRVRIQGRAELRTNLPRREFSIRIGGIFSNRGVEHDRQVRHRASERPGDILSG